MNLSKNLCIVLISALVVFSGCLKKPTRPTPDQTMGTQGSNLAGDNLAGAGIAGDQSAMGLTPRTDGVYEDENVIKGLLQPIYFDFDKSNIKESERPKLQAVKEYLEKNPQYRILFEGHCDWRGTAEYNLGLGDRRANAAKKYLMTLGIDASKIEVLSKGSLEAKEKGTAEEMSKDRRDEVIVLKK